MAECTVPEIRALNGFESGTILAELVGIGQGQWHQVLGFHVPQASVNTGGFIEFGMPVRATAIGNQQCGNRVPAMTFQVAGGTMVTGNQKHLGSQRIDFRNGGIQFFNPLSLGFGSIGLIRTSCSARASVTTYIGVVNFYMCC